MFKKLLSALTAMCLILGTTATLPDNIFAGLGGIEVTAATYGDYEYTVLDDGTVEISKYTGNEAKVTLPSEIIGKKVSSVGNWAFEDCENCKHPKRTHPTHCSHIR